MTAARGAAGAAGRLGLLGLALLATACTDKQVEARRRALGPHPTAAALLRAADAGRGQRVFLQCGSCHTLARGAPDHYGPNLYGVLGKPIGGVSESFPYTAALKAKGGRWTPETLSAWLENPQAFVPGTQMQFAGLADPLDRADVIAFLATPANGGPAAP